MSISNNVYISWHQQNENEDDANFQVKDCDENVFYLYYYPPVDGLWNNIKLEDFQFILLDSPYNNAESNIYEIKIDDISERVGYMFPINSLCSNEKHSKSVIDNYSYVSFWYLLTLVDKFEFDKNLITDYFHENLIVCALHKKALFENNIEFNLDLYLLSLFYKGYYLYKREKVSIVKGYDTTKYDCNSDTIHIRKSQSNCIDDTFMKKIFCDYLPKETVPIARFIIAYQAIEYLMNIICESEIKDVIKDFQENKIFKNDFFDKVGQLGGERKQISLIFNNIDQSHQSVKNFEKECSSLYDVIKYKYKKNGIHNLFYSFRNTLVHNYRELMGLEEQTIKTIQCFEQLIVHICNTVKIQ